MLFPTVNAELTRDEVWYDTSMSKELVSLVNGENTNGSKAISLSWTGDGQGYFAKLSPGKEWTADLPDNYPHQINELRSQFADFDVGLKTILFGHAGTHVYIFEAGFVAHFEGEAEEDEHPLNKASFYSYSQKYLIRLIMS